jgi:predicted transcriptional regulator
MEQARFVEELRGQHRMNVAEIAEALSRSKAWVSMRVGLMGELSVRVRQKLFSGAFPVYSYMYTLRQFMRMNKVGKDQIEEFVVAVSGKGLSVRDVEQLAHGYFRGPASFAEQIRQGNLALPLERLRQVPPPDEGCNAFEQAMLKDIEIVQKYMQRVMGKSLDKRLASPAFCAQAHLLLAGLLSRSPGFSQSVRQLHDRCGQT